MIFFTLQLSKSLDSLQNNAKSAMHPNNKAIHLSYIFGTRISLAVLLFSLNVASHTTLFCLRNSAEIKFKLQYNILKVMNMTNLSANDTNV